MDGLQAATGCTYGKLMMERLNFGKLAATLWTPDNGSVRVAIKPEFSDKLGKYEFFAYRKKGVEPSQIPEPVRLEIIEVVSMPPTKRCSTCNCFPITSMRR